MASTQKIERRAGSIRNFAREYAVSRDAITAAIQAGELPASRIGTRRFQILRADFERWLRGHAVTPSAHAADVVARRLEREST